MEFKELLHGQLSSIKRDWDLRANEFYINLCNNIPDMIRTKEYQKTIGCSPGVDNEFMTYCIRYIEKRTDGMVKCHLSVGSTNRIISLIATLQGMSEIIEKL